LQLHYHALPLTVRTRAQQKEQEARIVAMFHELGSTRLVADRLEMKHRTVSGILNRNGVATPRLGRRHNPYAACDKNAELVLQMCEEGYSLAEMARKVGTVGREVKKFLRRNGVTRDFPTTKTGEKHYAWKGKTVDKAGYILIHCKGHPNARKHTHYVFEHRLVMEESIGRYLLPNEVVHHLDGNKQNNAIENLQLFQSNAEHLAVDLKGRCPKWTEEGKRRIQEGTVRRWRYGTKSNRPPSEVDARQCIEKMSR
jgi:hypothetical protein